MNGGASDTAATSASLPAEENARVRVYRLLAVLLAAPPGEEILRILREVQSDDGDLARAWQELREAAQAADTHRLEEEYNLLFIGLGGGELTPYASKYLTGFLMERPLAELRTTLRRYGVARRDGRCEPEDHAAALCETMALLIAANELSFKEARDFFDTHIGSWMAQFFSDLANAESAGFYAAVGRLGQAFVGIERTYFSMPA